MCLHKVQGPFLAHEDIEVVKYLRQGYDMVDRVVDGARIGTEPVNVLKSPWMGAAYKVGEEYALDTDSDYWKETLAEAVEEQKVSYGFHSYINQIKPNLDAANIWSDRRTDLYRSLKSTYQAKPYRAIIPKGTAYFVGVCDWDQPAYPSHKIKLVSAEPLKEVE